MYTYIFFYYQCIYTMRCIQFIQFFKMLIHLSFLKMFAFLKMLIHLLGWKLFGILSLFIFFLFENLYKSIFEPKPTTYARDQDLKCSLSLSFNDLAPNLSLYNRLLSLPVFPPPFLHASLSPLLPPPFHGHLGSRQAELFLFSHSRPCTLVLPTLCMSTPHFSLKA